MEFSGEFELDGVSPEDAWIVLSDPIAVRDSLKGCRYITPIDDDDFNFDDYEAEEDVQTLPDADPDVVAERAFNEGVVYAALMQVGVGSVKPRFETRVTIAERAFPRMVATGGGDASNSSFEMESWMDIEETESGSIVKWGTEADVSGRIAQLGGRVMNPVADKIVSNFFKNIQKQMTGFEESEESKSMRDRLSGLL
ncbi:CoxG family protein [Salinigranum marinum]|uniref:CoxG family protein n=1 Tax=Salinigranum marinum TaxID=1515595 RepID=UPI002989BA20|nr:SRPBCC domain-containing protein [Salinigranum marinum]